MKKPKLIHIDKSILEKLQHIAVDDKTNPKNWIEDLVESEVIRREGKKKIN